MQILTACPLCQANYNPLKTQIMAERDDAHLLYLECRQCGSSVVAVVTTGSSGLSSIGTVTDLTSQEVAAFQADVTADDVVDLYAWMKQGDHSWLDWQTGRL
ncbi:MAG: hypothetical protein HYY50_03815 [Candidatus Kerfeldbacteria bacterium]|nr:hypothetical protein [Candidatus Kerfeldbacteria bacterium]